MKNLSKYNFSKVEAKWQKRWLEDKVFQADDKSKKPKFYQLETFPYPSAAGLHVGHPKGYIAEDVHARFMRMNGKEVLYTIGWDAFGLPTENYAIKVGKSPKEVAKENVKNFKRQVQMFGLSYDWDREINTSEPEYYKWTQWLFIQLYKKGLAYRAKAKVNWCPVDMTVLANEQVVQKEGKNVCERCGAEVIQKEMDQWFLKITDYAERLLKDLKGLDWPEATIKRQEDWIGRSEGAEIKFSISNSQFSINVFTTRPDTLFGATYLVLSPEHEEVINLKSQISNWEEVREYIEKAKRKTELERIAEAKDKTGVELKGVKAVNPATKEEIPVWVADYVLGSYGTGAIMAVPAHDDRDFEFAKKYGLKIQQVVMPYVVDSENPPQPGKKNTERNIVHCFVKHPKENKFLALRSKKMPWLTPITGGVEEGESVIEAAEREVKEETGYKSAKFTKEMPLVFFAEFFAAHKDVNRSVTSHVLYFELQDLERGVLSKEEEDLHSVEWVDFENMNSLTPVGELPFILKWFKEGDYAFSGHGLIMNSEKFDGMDSERAKWEIMKAVGGERKIQYKIRDWSVSRQRYWGVPIPMVSCTKCGIHPVADKDLPVLLPDLEDYRPKGKPPLASSDKFIKTECPKCGETAEREPETLDTFVDSSWYYLRYTDPKNAEEIFDKKKVNHWMPVDLYVIGAEHTVLHLLYSRFITKFLQDEGYLKFSEPFLKLRHVGLIRGSDGQKMSKSRGNVVNPDTLIEEFGADSFRVYEMFMGPFEDGQPWDPQGVIGAERFLARVWKLYARGIDTNMRISANDTNIGKFERLMHKTIKKVSEDIQNLSFNTAISALMILFNDAEKQEKLPKSFYGNFLKLLHPFAPHMTQELWQELLGSSKIDDRGSKEFKSITYEEWPKFDENLIKDESFNLIIQVNGKVRDSVEVEAGISQAEAEKLVLSREKVQAYLNGEKPKKVIYVTGRLVNLVV